MNLIFSLLLLSQAARADLTFVDVDKIVPTTTITEPTVEGEFTKFNVFKSNRITIERSGMMKADLIAAWRQQQAGREDIDSYYYKNNRDVYHKIDEDFKAVYDSISTSATNQLVQNLAYEGVAFKAPSSLGVSSFILKNGARPAVYTYKGKRVMLVMTAVAVCIVNNRVVRTEVPLKLFSKLKCPGGHTEWMAQFNGLEYQPLCDGQYCKKGQDAKTPVQSYLIGAKLIAVPDSRPPVQVVHALENTQ